MVDAKQILYGTNSDLVRLDPIPVRTTSFDATPFRRYYCDTSIGGFDVTLPPSPLVGTKIELVDYLGTFGGAGSPSQELVILRNGSLINGDTLNLSITTNFAYVTLEYVDGETQGWISNL